MKHDIRKNDSPISLIFPHQLYPDHPAALPSHRLLFLEEPLFFSQYAFHKQKLMLHRASMRRRADEFRNRGFDTYYYSCRELEGPGRFAAILQESGAKTIFHVEVDDDWLDQKIVSALSKNSQTRTVLKSPNFLTEREEGQKMLDAAGGAKTFFTSFYVSQRKRLDILLENGKPVGGQWSFDAENRKKLPKGHTPPERVVSPEDEFTTEARDYVEREFPNSMGESSPLLFASSEGQANLEYSAFLSKRFSEFGIYEDSISARFETIHHSVLTPALNIGLINPDRVIDLALQQQGIPLNSSEGFVRQVIGWREYIRLLYHRRGRNQRSKNFFQATHRLPSSFYSGRTGILPFDSVVQRVQRTAYCHHIERLMILGNFMLLCDIHPDAVYQWFMELFIDAYDWVMVPNVYGMSQYADGGSMTTKPYLSGSNYILKMSDYPKGPWCETWDALYWRFIHKHLQVFAGNQRMQMMTSLLQKMQHEGKLDIHLRRAESFLKQLHQS